VAIEALKGIEQACKELAAKFSEKLHPSFPYTISKVEEKREFLENADLAFGVHKPEKGRSRFAGPRPQLYNKIGQLQGENDSFLKKAFGQNEPTTERRQTKRC